MSPLSNAFLRAEQLRSQESFYPLHAYVCEGCFLVQIEQSETPERIFSDYVYFSSYSDTWLAHCREYVQRIVPKLGLGPSSKVVELASNDGYLLRYFQEAGIPVLGVEPAGNVAEVAESRGIPTLVRFFGVEAARAIAARGWRADLLIGNNVLAHVPDLNDFVTGMALALAPQGTIAMEFPHLLRLIEGNQFDTIYHEHFSYFSFWTVQRVFARHGLTIYDVEELATHGGSLRVFAAHTGSAHRPHRSVDALLERERIAGLMDLSAYSHFGAKVQATKRRLLEFLIGAKDRGKTIAAYGAAAKGNTLLNYCGVRSDFIDYVVDRNPTKQGRFLPGTHLSVYDPERVRETRPDYLLILPWNIKQEVIDQMAHIRQWGGQFVVPIPTLEILT
jgi:SAM-dependent methyltransferase